MSDPFFLNVLAWNGERWLRPCLDSLLESLSRSGRPGRLLVVDNGSTDATPDILKGYAERLDILRLPRNTGFAEGHNRGIRRALERGARWIGLLNQDLRVDPGWLAPLWEAAAQNPRIGVLSPFQYDYDGKDLDPGFRRTLTFLPDARQGLETGRWEAPYYLSDMAAAAAILVHRQVFERVGLFDPAYFAYHEEGDLYHRVQAAGIHIALVPKSRVFHWHTLRRQALPFLLGWVNVRNFYRQLLKDPRSSFSKNLIRCKIAWFQNLFQALARKRWKHGLLLLAVGLADLPLRVPAIFLRRRQDMALLRRQRDAFSNRAGE